MNRKKEIITYTILVFVCILVTCIVYGIKSIPKEKYIVYYTKNSEQMTMEFAQEAIRNEQNRTYIKLSELQKIYQNDLFYDKLSRKLIVTTSNLIVKYDIEGREKNINFSENSQTLEHIVATNIEDECYVDISEIASIYNQKVYIDKEQHVIWISSVKEQPTSFKYNRPIVYNINNQAEILTSKHVQVSIIDEFDEKYVLLITTNQSNMLRRVNKNNITNKIQNTINQSNEEKKEFKKYVVQDANYIVDDYDYQLVNYMELNSVYGEISIAKIILGEKTIPIYTNSYHYSNYDDNILSVMLQSEQTRSENIIQVVNHIKNINKKEIIIDFRQIYEKVLPYYIEYIKEFVAYAHLNDIQVGVYLTSNIESFIPAMQNVDKVYISGVKEVMNATKISQSPSGLKDMKEKLLQVLQFGISSSKIVIEVPVYSILWCEKNNIVISSEYYSQHATEEFVRLNGLQAIIDEKNKQEYVEFTKGSITYKMWLENDYSLEEKIKLAKEYNLLGISIYSSKYLKGE